MKVRVEVWKQEDDQRSYLPESGVVLTTRPYPISWFAEKETAELDLDEAEEDFAVGIFAVTSITAVVLSPGYLQVTVSDPNQWAEAEPAILSVLAEHIGADEIVPFDSPQNMN
jgi:hypothetical protein